MTINLQRLVSLLVAALFFCRLLQRFQLNCEPCIASTNFSFVFRHAYLVLLCPRIVFIVTMVDVNADNLRQSDLAKLPLYAGDAKDQFTAEQWTERISRSRTASAWTAEQTIAFVFNALRGNALRWFDALKRSGIDRNDWDAFKRAFLAAFSTTRTPRTATVNLTDLHQGQTEQVVSFYSSEFGSEKGLTPGLLRRIGESETK